LAETKAQGVIEVGKPSMHRGYFLRLLIHLVFFNTEQLIKTSPSEPLEIKIHSKNMRENPTNATIIHSVY
jgi:hypothetical protein